MRPNRLLDYRRMVMGIIMWLVVGGVIGWLASIIMRTDGQQGIILNIVVGIIGSFIGGLILSRGDINNAPLTAMTFLVSLARSEEHTSELQSLMRISYAVFCLNKKN